MITSIENTQGTRNGIDELQSALLELDDTIIEIENKRKALLADDSSPLADVGKMISELDGAWELAGVRRSRVQSKLDTAISDLSKSRENDSQIL